MQVTTLGQPVVWTRPLTTCVRSKGHHQAALVHGRACTVCTHLHKYVEAQAVDVVDVTQTEEAGEDAAAQHPRRQVQPDGQPLADDAAVEGWRRRQPRGDHQQVTS